MRLIDADAINPMRVPQSVKEMRAWLDSQPTVDAVPVKHGRWEFIGGYGYQYRCSECINCVERKTKFCPHCGARMDKGKRGMTDQEKWYQYCMLCEHSYKRADDADMVFCEIRDYRDCPHKNEIEEDGRKDSD